MTARTAIRHNFATFAECPHPDCGGQDRGYVTGFQCADCGHYFPRTRVKIGEDSEPRCRAGMGCDMAPTIRHAIRRRREAAARKS